MRVCVGMYARESQNLLGVLLICFSLYILGQLACGPQGTSCPVPHTAAPGFLWVLQSHLPVAALCQREPELFPSHVLLSVTFLQCSCERWHTPRATLAQLLLCYISNFQCLKCASCSNPIYLLRSFHLHKIVMLSRAERILLVYSCRRSKENTPALCLSMLF